MTQRTRVVLVVSAAVFMASLDLFIVNIAFPDIQRDFAGTSDASLSWVLNAYAIVYAALLVPLGRLADLVGRKRVFLSGLIAFCAASALCAAAPSAGALVAARVLQAAGAAAITPTSLALLLPEFPPERRAVGVAAWAATGAVAGAAGPPLGGLLVQASWHWIFLVNLPVGLAAAIAGLRVLREQRDTEPVEALPDLAGAVVLVAGVGALTAAIVEGPSWGWSSGRVVGLLAAAVVLLALFLRRSARHAVPVVELSLLRVRSFASATTAALLFFAGFAAMLLSSVLFLTRVWGESALTAGLMVSPGPLMAATFAVPAGVLAARLGQRAVLLPGTIAFALGMVWWLTQAGTTPDYAGAFLPGMIIGGAGVGLTIPTLSSAAAASLPPARFATGTGVFGMARQLGSALGVAVLVAILGTPAPADTLPAFRHGWVFIIGVALAAAAVGSAMGRVRAPEPEGALAPQAA
jgi:EmrB/QacA subfamily drug resistance transporter